MIERKQVSSRKFIFSLYDKITLIDCNICKKKLNILFSIISILLYLYTDTELLISISLRSIFYVSTEIRYLHNLELIK